MMYIEVTLARDRKGRAVSSMRCPVDDETVTGGKTKVVKSSYGHVVILDFSKMKAEFWRPGTPGDRRHSEIKLVSPE